MKDFGIELKRARTTGVGMPVSPFCDICGKQRGGRNNHQRCSKIRQQRGFNERSSN